MIKTVSLELAKQLKETGFPQDAEYWYSIDLENAFYNLFMDNDDRRRSQRNDDSFEWIAAPTAEEILERLPLSTSIRRNRNDYSCHAQIQGVRVIRENTASEAAGLMWLCLKEKGALK